MAWDVGQIVANINNLAAEMQTKALIGLEKGAEFVGQKSDTMVPLDEGPLQNSRKVTRAGNRAAISYNTPYAVKQHEDMTLVHPNGRQPKYLEQALNSAGTRVPDIIQAEMGGLF